VPVTSSERHPHITTIVLACMNMSKAKVVALIVNQGDLQLTVRAER
jgi:hypothetical protein